ncbi:molybdate ABC transporter substrate-binding protein [Fodinicurvata sediminis]|uniref:molybdate ABC transporter substrate-binding protein n=1 Tax=Fodinicurvata sediminis TaxID=1121832 RepID=UPI0003B51279|nr:molybdate ABC transporter substrate-binding protein [Fodinicurvata sediminis]
MSLLAAMAFGLAATPAAAEPVKLLAAGSLRAALSEASQTFTAAEGTEVANDFAPSGLLRERIMEGEAVDVFASANMKHPQAIAAERGGEVVAFARNRLCAIAQPDLEVTSDSLLEVMLREDVRVGTSTPKADPSGDYAFQLFDKAEAFQDGAAEKLKEKSLQLTGGPDSPQPDEPRSVYGWVMEERRADLFLTYCTNAVLAAEEVPELRIIDIPENLNVGATYGLLVLSDSQGARSLADFILSPTGQSILQDYGFAPPPA